MSWEHGPAAAARAGGPQTVRITAEGVLEKMPVAFLSADEDLRIAYANRAAEQLLRIPREQLIGAELREVFPEAPGTEFHDAALLAVREQVAVELEEHYPCPLNGWFEVHLSPLDDGLSVYLRDITERRGTEEALQRKNSVVKLLKGIAAAVNDSSGVDDAIRACLAAVCEHLDWPLGRAYLVTGGEALVSTAIWQPQRSERFGRFRGVTEALRLGRGAGLAGRTLAAGAPTWSRDISRDPDLPRSNAAADSGIKAGVAYPVFAGSTVVAVLEAFSDMEADPDELLMEAAKEIGSLLGRAIERHRAIEDLRESTRRYRDLVDSMRDIVWTVAYDGVIRSLNPAFERTLDRDPDEWIGKSFTSLVHPDDLEATMSVIDESLRGGSPPVLEARLVARSGEYVPVEITAEPGFEDGRVVYALVIARDISERGRAEEAVRRRDGILDAVGFAAKRFLAAASWTDDINEVLGRLGETIGVSRAYIFENHRAEDGTLRHSQRFEWVAEGVATLIDDPLLQDFSFAEQRTARWQDMLERGEIVTGHTRELPACERPVLALQDILSIAVVPIFVEGQWWGFMGFDECRTEREWSVAEIDALRAAADTLAFAIGREQFDAQLREAEGKYRNLVETIPAVTYVEGLVGNAISYVSPQYQKLFGYTPEERIADPGLWSKLLHPNDRERAKAEADRTDLTGEPFRMEYRMIARDGRVVWVRDEANLVRDVEGRPIYWQGVLFDITDRVDAEEQLRTAQAKYRILVENMPAISYVQAVDANAVDWYMSPQVRTILGFDPEDFEDPDFWASRIHPEDRDRVEAENARTNATGSPFSCEFRFIASDGRPVWIRDEAVLVRGEEGRALFWQGIMMDVSDRKRAEAELQRSFDMLRRADEDRRQLLARLVKAQEAERHRIASDIHDDTIQKMTAVGMRVETLRRHVPESGRRSLQQVQETVELSIGRLRHLMFELRPPSLDREGLAAALAQHLAELASEANLEANLEDRMVSEPTAVARTVAYRVAQEALANVRKHASASRVGVLLETREAGLFVRITDDGQGFTRTEVDSRTGHLGLSSMRERTELAGGWWRIESTPGAGTVVEFLLPSGER